MTSPFNFFDKIACINLTRRPDRLEQATELFNELGITHLVARFDALDYSAYEAIPDRDKGKYGCTHSHMEIVRQAKAKGLKSVLIFEDDVKLHRTPDEINEAMTKCIEEIPDDWEMFYLSGNPLENLCTIKLTFTTHAVAISERAYDHILKGAENHDDVVRLLPDIIQSVVNIDGYYMNVVLPHHKSYIPKKLLFTQRNSFSDIDFDTRDLDDLITERYGKFDLLEA